MPREPAAGTTADDIVRGAESYAAVGVSTLVARSDGDDPAGALEQRYGSIIDRLGAIEPARL